MAYVPDPTDPTNPFDTVDASTAAAEFRALKGYLASLAGGSGFAGFNVFRKNAIIGGDFDTNPFQRGNNFIAAANLQYVADRWKYGKNGTMVETVSRTAAGPTVANAGYLVNNCLGSVVTTAEAVIGAGDFSIYTQFIEGYNWKNLAQIPIVLSFWHNHSKPGIYSVALRNSGVDRVYVGEYSQLNANTWEFATVVIPASPAGGTWNYTNGWGVTVDFVKAAGVNFQIAPGAWVNSAVAVASVNQVNGMDTIGNTFNIAQVQLEAGSIATKFERRSFQDELLMCQRYYEKTFPMLTVPAQNAGVAGALSLNAPTTNANAINWQFCARKRANPTITTFNPSANNNNWRDVTAGADKAFSLLQTTEWMTYIFINAIVAVNDLNQIHATADADL